MKDSSKISNKDETKEQEQLDCPFLDEKQEPSSESKKETNVQKIQMNESLSCHQPVKKCCFVELKPDASFVNLISFYLVQFSYVCFFSFMDSMQPHLLEDPNYIKDIHDKDEAGRVNSDLLFYDNLYLVRDYLYRLFSLLSLGLSMMSSEGR